MNDLLLIVVFLLAWIALNRWILPAMGIQTCMSGGCCGSSCQAPPRRAALPPSEEERREADSATPLRNDVVSSK